MKYKKFLGTASAALMIVIAIFTLVSSAGAASKFKTLYAFTGGADGHGSYANLIFDQAGSLYGTTAYGGNLSCNSGYGCGVVFKLTPNADGSWTESVLYSFTGGADGSQPGTGLIFDQAGNLYGTTGLGGNLAYCQRRGCGVVFKLAPNADGSWSESVLYSFLGSGDGRSPTSGVIFDTAGNLYGTTGGDSRFKGGNVFKLTPNADGSWTETILKIFSGRKGEIPVNGVIFDQKGNLYGTTYLRLSGDGCGVVFELTPKPDGSWAEKVLHQGSMVTVGCSPQGGLIFDQTGNLYGTTEEGGAYGYGVVYKLSRNSKGAWHETVLHTFANHEYPQAGLVIDAAGNLYGTTSGENSTTVFGTVFEITP